MILGLIMALDDDKKREVDEFKSGIGGIANTANSIIQHKQSIQTPFIDRVATAPKAVNAEPVSRLGAMWNKTANVAKHPIKSTAGGIKGASRLAAKVTAPVTLGSAVLDYKNNTENDVYDERFGGFFRPEDDDWEATKMAKFATQQGLGYATDVANVLTGGLAKKYLYQDGIREENERKLANAEQTEKLKTLAEQSQTNTDQNSTELPRTQYSIATPKIDAPPTAQQYQGGIGVNNQNYADLMAQVQASQKALLENQNPLQGRQIRTPERNWKDEAERKDLLSQAMTVQKGAKGLTAAQMRLAHDLTNDDIKLEQERYLQQNNLNHQLAQHNAEQQGQNNRLMASQTADLAKAMMNEQGQNARFNANLGLDVAKFNQDSLNDQYRLGLQGAELQSKLAGDSMDNQVKSETMNLYNQFLNAKDDDERQKALTNLAVLTGKGGGDDGARYATINNAEGGQSLYNTKTGQILGGTGQQGGQQPKADWNNEQDRAKIMANAESILKKGGTANEIRQALIAEGVPADKVEQLMGASQ